MVAGHHRAIEPSIIHCSLQSFARSLRGSANLDGTKVRVEGEDSFGQVSISVESCEGHFGYRELVLDGVV